MFWYAILSFVGLDEWTSWLNRICAKMRQAIGLVPSATSHPTVAAIQGITLKQNTYRVEDFSVRFAMLLVQHVMPWKCTCLESIGKTGTELLFSALNDAIKAKIYKTEGGLYNCYECGYSSKYKTTCQDHVESRHISTAGFICPYCQKFCPTRNALKSHISKNHK